MLIFIDTIHPLSPRNKTTTMLEQKVPIVHTVQANKSETMFLFSSHYQKINQIFYHIDSTDLHQK